MSEYKILIVEDEAQLQMGLKDNLEFEGYEVDVASDGREGLEKALQGNYDLIVLDIMLPRISGFDVCRKIKEAKIKSAIVMLSAKGEEMDKVVGLELGADDYVTKPFSLRELLARLKAVLRRREAQPTNNTKGEPVVIGLLSLDFETYTAMVDSNPVALTHREFEILRYLWEHRNHVVSRDELLSSVWGYDESPTTRTVDNFILRLRQKIEADVTYPRHILTVHGVGYKLVV